MNARKKNTKNSEKRNQKYLGFLHSLYAMTSADYSKVGMSKLTSLHRVDGRTSTALRQLGILSNVGDVKNKKYFWRGSSPNTAMVGKILDTIVDIKKNGPSKTPIKRSYKKRATALTVTQINHISPKSNQAIQITIAKQFYSLGEYEQANNILSELVD